MPYMNGKVDMGSYKADLAAKMAKKKKRNKQPSAFTKAVGETGSLPGGSSMGANKPAFFTDQIRI